MTWCRLESGVCLLPWTYNESVTANTRPRAAEAAMLRRASSMVPGFEEVRTHVSHTALISEPLRVTVLSHTEAGCLDGVDPAARGAPELAAADALLAALDEVYYRVMPCRTRIPPRSN